MTKPASFADCKTLEDFEAFFPERHLPADAEVTRIAPSPTGMPHIGTGMQAVLDRSIADQTKGIFILRIEDTDQARTVPGAVEAIIEGLKWLNTIPNEGAGFGGDYGPYTQTERKHLYRAAAEKMVSTGHAYPCFCTEERLDLVRKTQTAQHQTPGYDGHCRDLPADDVKDRIAKGEKHVLRLRVPENEKITFYDEVRGDITFDTANAVDDSVIMKSDGLPTYHLAAMVDDHFMRVTMVVRGEEWISSTPKHILIYKALGWKAPKFLHTVLLRDKERRKLSKRSGDSSLNWFRRQGIMPDAFCNFLYRVMWAHPEGKDIYPMSEFAEKLKLTGLPSTGPVADMDLLSFINGKYLAALSPAALKTEFLSYLDFLIDNNLSASNTLHQDEDEIIETKQEDLKKLRDAIKGDDAYAASVLSVAAQRSVRFADLAFNCGYYYDYGYAPPAAEKLDREVTDRNVQRQIFSKFLDVYQGDAQAPETENILKAIAKELGLKDRAAFMSIRLAMTGQEKTPPLSEVAAILGIARVKKRIENVLHSLPAKTDAA